MHIVERKCSSTGHPHSHQQKLYIVLGLIFKTKAVVSLARFSFQEEEISMLGEITHLQTISDDLKSLTMDPHKLPSSSEQVSSCYLENILFGVCTTFSFVWGGILTTRVSGLM